jgi:hypothetical protein
MNLLKLITSSRNQITKDIHEKLIFNYKENDARLLLLREIGKSYRPSNEEVANIIVKERNLREQDDNGYVFNKYNNIDHVLDNISFD